MYIASYCKDQGMDLQGYENYKSNIQTSAQAIVQLIKQNYKTDNGIYHDTTEILGLEYKWTETTLFIIQALKQLQVEFIDNNKLWRL